MASSAGSDRCLRWTVLPQVELEGKVAKGVFQNRALVKWLVLSQRWRRFSESIAEVESRQFLRFSDLGVCRLAMGLSLLIR